VDDDGVVARSPSGPRTARGGRGPSPYRADPRSSNGRGRRGLQGRVVNIAKFGAFVSIMPGRDGLLHISKMAPLNDGKRIGQVEDVVELGQAIEVRVDDIDPQGKVSLSLAGEYANADVSESPRGPRPREKAVTAAPVTIVAPATTAVPVTTEARATIVANEVPTTDRLATTPPHPAPRPPSRRPLRPSWLAKSATWVLAAHPHTR